MSVMSDEQIYEEIVAIITGNQVALFMKGTPEEPRCGFSARVAERILESGVEFVAVDILPDPRIRQQLTAYSNWPTTPQLFVGGELIGGCDIVEELHAQGELSKILGVEADAAS
ncbi:MAG: Grx4 family monothiol glutaredoxin [Gaiellales bacterium]